MYGSKSDHSKSRRREPRRDEGSVLTRREAIEEGLLAHLDMDEPASQVTREVDEGERAYRMYADEQPLAEWEWELLREPGDHSTYADYVDDFTAMQDERADAEDFGEFYGDPQEQDYDEEQDLDSEEHPSAWLTIAPAEFFDAVGNAFVIEGPSLSPEPIRTNHVRVHELARRAGVPSKALVDFLRTEGEYVRCAQSFVTQPVVDKVLRMEGLVDALGARKVSPSFASDEAIRSLRERLTQPRNLRPGAPRPGNNPFNRLPAR